MRRAALLFLLVTACAHAGFVSDRLYCGLSIPNGGQVTQAQLDAFVAEVVEPRFPGGFTMYRAEGRWRGGAEQTIVFEFVHPRDPKLDAAVREIAEAYRVRFAQEAVLRVTTGARMFFER